MRKTRWKCWLSMLLAGLCAWCTGCWLSAALPDPAGPAMEPLGEEVYLLRGVPDAPAVRSLGRTTHVLILVPGVSSGDLATQSRFLSHLRRRTGAQVAIFHHWGQYDPTRRMAAPTATSRAAATLASFCELMWRQAGPQPHIDVLAHSAGTIVVNKAALHLATADSPVRLRHVLFLGTPHAPDADLTALKQRCEALLNLHSVFDKINRNVSGAEGALEALPAPPYWNRSLDRSLGGRRTRHNAFLEDTAENRVQYGHFLRTGRWLTPLAWPDGAPLTAIGLHRHALHVRAANPGARQGMVGPALLRRCLAHPDPEIRYYGALLAALAGEGAVRPALKATLEAPEQPDMVRREIYQALGAMEDPRDLRYLQQRRQSDPEAGDVLRDVLRAWKRRRIRPPRESRR